MATIGEWQDQIDKKISDTNTSISKTTTLQNDLDESIAAFKVELGNLEFLSDSWGAAKAVEMSTRLGGNYHFCTSGSYGVDTNINGNLTEWGIVSGSSCANIQSFPVCGSGDVTVTADTDQYYRQIDYSTYITHIYAPVDGTNGTFGLQDKRDNLDTVLDILGEDLTQLNKLKDALER